MTTADLHARCLANVPASDRAQFGPFFLLILGAIISTVVSHFVEKCLDRWDHKSVANPGLYARARLRWLVRSCSAMPEVTGLGPVGDEHRRAAYDTLIATGRGLTSTEYASLKDAYA